MSLFTRPKLSEVMSPSWRRRAIGLAAAAASVALLAWLADWLRSRLVDPSFATGTVLFGMVLFLAAFQLRKRIPSPPLGSAALWMQIHIYAGMAVMGVFVLHVGWRWPVGMVETPLAALFVFVCASGLYGLFISRTYPKKLAALREQVIFERIPQAIRQVAADAHALAANRTLSGDEIEKAYTEFILPFISGPRGIGYWLRPTGEGRRQVVARLRDIHRYLNPERLRIAKELELLVCKKDDFDYHAALQGKLKLWLWFHIAGTHSMLVLALIHAVVAHAFHGGSR